MTSSGIHTLRVHRRSRIKIKVTPNLSPDKEKHRARYKFRSLKFILLFLILINTKRKMIFNFVLCKCWHSILSSSRSLYFVITQIAFKMSTKWLHVLFSAQHLII